MAAEESATYYERRRRASEAMSDAAAEPAARNIHLELARHYAVLAGDPGVQESVDREATSGPNDGTG